MANPDRQRPTYINPREWARAHKARTDARITEREVRDRRPITRELSGRVVSLNPRTWARLHKAEVDAAIEEKAERVKGGVRRSFGSPRDWASSAWGETEAAIADRAARDQAPALVRRHRGPRG